MSPGICSSAPQCYFNRMEPPLRSGFVGRLLATLEKRIPINLPAGAFAFCGVRTARACMMTTIRERFEV